MVPNRTGTAGRLDTDWHVGEKGGAVRRIHLVRHAMPALSPWHGPKEWRLSDDGVEAARALGGTLPTGVRVLVSDELKAQQTLREAGFGDVEVDARFGEVGMPPMPLGSDVRPARRRWVAGEMPRSLDGWEPMVLAARRFDAAVAERSDDLVIGTHGMVLTAWLVSIGHVRAGESAARFWEGLRFADVVTVEI